MAGIDRFWKGFEEGYEVAREGILYAAELAEDASKRAGTRLKIFTKKRQIERNYASLGKTVYGLYKEKKKNIIGTSKVKAAFKEIKTLEDDILKLLKKLEKEEAKAVAKPAKKKRPAKAGKAKKKRT